MILRPTPVSTEQLKFDKEENLLVAEDSSLPRPSRVYDDACDEGYTVVSHHTGREVVYASDTSWSDGGDLLYWDYRPVNRADWECPTLRVFND